MFQLLVNTSDRSLVPGVRPEPSVQSEFPRRGHESLATLSASEWQQLYGNCQAGPTSNAFTSTLRAHCRELYCRYIIHNRFPVGRPCILLCCRNVRVLIQSHAFRFFVTSRQND